MTFGEKLDELMKTRGYRIDYVADMIEVAPRTLRYWIKGKMKPRKHEIYERLAKFFDVSDAYFWDEDNETDPVNLLHRVKKIENRLTVLESKNGTNERGNKH